MMSRYFELTEAAIERHGGTVEKFIGDAVMAVFGLPELHEDDALRAVRAAVEVRDAVVRISAGPQSGERIGFQVRIGVNTGEVVAGDATRRQRLVTGDAVNIAARLQQAAQPGEILLGAITRELMRDAIDAEPIGLVELKGIAEPVTPYRLLALRSTSESPAPRFEAPMVGRDDELATVRRAFDAAVQGRSGRLVTLIGAAGVGKSRLTHEFVTSVRSQATVLRGQCLPYGEGITYWPIALAVRSAAGIDPADDFAVATSKLEAFVADLPASDRIATQLGSAIGLGTGLAPREEIGWAVRRLLEGKAATRPCVFVVDDIQWAEETLLDLLESIVVRSHGSPIFLLCIARPELFEARPGWGTGVQAAVTIRLEPLPGEAVTTLIANLGGGGQLPVPVIELLTSTAEGNPLFIEEILAMLIDDGFLQREDGRWRFAAQASAVKVPATIQALLAARLDRLDPADRAVAQRGAVIGRVFQRAAVFELSPEPERPRVDGCLVSLVGKELIRTDTGDADGDTFRFRHLLVRDAAYEGLLKQERSHLHRRFADWLLLAVGDRLHEFEEIVGYHLEQAFRYRLELGFDDDETTALGTAASRHLAAAALRALDRSDMPAAAGLLRRTLDTMRDDDPRRFELSAELIDALMQTGRITDAAAHLEAMRKEPGVEEDPRLRSWWELMRLSVALHSRSGHAGAAYSVEEARAVIESAIREFELSGDVAGLARAWFAEAEAQWWLLHMAAATEAYERALGYARLEGRRSHEITLLSELSNSYAWGPDPVDVALGKVDGIVDAAKGDRRVEAGAQRDRAFLLAFVGRADDAAAELEASQATFTEIGMQLEAAASAQAHYFIGLASGRFDEARLYLEAKNLELEALGEEGNLSTALALDAALLLDAGLVEDAEAVMLHAASISSPDDLATRSFCQVLAAQVDVHHGNLGRATDSAEAALDLLADSDSNIHIADVCARAAEVYLAAGHEKRSRELFGEAIDRYRRKGATAYVALVERRVASLDREEHGQ